jgi:hypothetical protein
MPLELSGLPAAAIAHGTVEALHSHWNSDSTGILIYLT